MVTTELSVVPSAISSLTAQSPEPLKRNGVAPVPVKACVEAEIPDPIGGVNVRVDAFEASPAQLSPV